MEKVADYSLEKRAVPRFLLEAIPDEDVPKIVSHANLALGRYFHEDGDLREAIGYAVSSLRYSVNTGALQALNRWIPEYLKKVPPTPRDEAFRVVIRNLHPQLVEYLQKNLTKS